MWKCIAMSDTPPNMEHLLSPLHWANVSVYSKSLKGCAFEFARYWNASHGHILLPLPWYCRHNSLDSNGYDLHTFSIQLGLGKVH